MRQGWCNSWLAFALLILAGVAAPVLAFNARAEQPRISLIEPFVNNQVLIHFDTEGKSNLHPAICQFIERDESLGQYRHEPGG